MMKGFQQNNKSKLFKGFNNLNFQMNNDAYGASSCVMWLEASSGTNTQTNAAAVTYWIDKIIGRVFSQTVVGSQPSYISSSSDFNNKPAILFTGGRHLFNTINTVPLATNFSIVAVIKVNSLQILNTFIAGSNSTFRSGWGGTATTLGSPDGLWSRNAAGSQVYTYGPEDFLPHIVIITSTKAYINGVKYGPHSYPAESSIAYIGGFDVNNSLTGNMAEILIYNSDLSDDQCSQVSDNLNQKYVIY